VTDIDIPAKTLPIGTKIFANCRFAMLIAHALNTFLKDSVIQE
jgi:hypothetical protein